MALVTFTAAEQRELAAVATLHKAPKDRPILLTARQISLASTLPLSSIGAALDRGEASGELLPVVQGTRAYLAGHLAKWCQKHREATATRLATAALSTAGSEFADPSESVRRYLKALLAQDKTHDLA